MKELFKKIDFRLILKYIKDFLSSKFFPFVTAAVILFCYYLGLDIVAIYYIAISGILILLLLDDITPLICNFLFMVLVVSRKNSPSPTLYSSQYYFHPAIFVQIIIVIALYACTLVYKIAITAKNGKFKFTPAFFGLAAFGATLLLNGVFSKGYNPMNLAYGFFLCFAFLATFSVLKDNITCNEKQFKNIALYFTAFSLTLIIELFVLYCTVDGVISGGVVQKTKLLFGWGIYNNMGMYLLLCIAPVMYLAGKYKYGYLFYAYGIAVAAAALLTGSRQALVGAVIILPLSIAVLLITGKNKIINGAITGVLALIGIILLIVFREKVAEIFIKLFKSGDPSSGRYALWRAAVENFKSAPVFGTGFYVELFDDPGFDGMAIIPDMYHNTFLQLLASCGIAGFAAYIVHRVQTVISFCKNITRERTFIAISMLALLIVNLLDNHLFYLFPTFIYACLVAVLIKSEKKEELKPLTENTPEPAETVNDPDICAE